MHAKECCDLSHCIAEQVQKHEVGKFGVLDVEGRASDAAHLKDTGCAEVVLHVFQNFRSGQEEHRGVLRHRVHRESICLHTGKRLAVVVGELRNGLLAFGGIVTQAIVPLQIGHAQRKE